MFRLPYSLKLAIFRSTFSVSKYRDSKLCAVGAFCTHEMGRVIPKELDRISARTFSLEEIWPSLLGLWPCEYRRRPALGGVWLESEKGYT